MVPRTVHWPGSLSNPGLSSVLELMLSSVPPPHLQYSTVQYSTVQCSATPPPVLLAHVLGRQPAHPLQSLHILLDQLTATITLSQTASLYLCSPVDPPVNPGNVPGDVLAADLKQMVFRNIS